MFHQVFIHNFLYFFCRQCENQTDMVETDRVSNSSSQMKGPIPWIVGFVLGIQIGAIGATGIGTVWIAKRKRAAKRIAHEIQMIQLT